MYKRQPLLSAVMLMPLDEAMNRLWWRYGLFYVRYMDDFVIMAPTRHKLLTCPNDSVRKKRECGRMVLRQKLFELGLQGKVPILIFVAKNWLGMSDRGDQAACDGPLPWVD